MRPRAFLSAAVLAAALVIPSTGATLGAGPDPERAVTPGAVPVAESMVAGSYWTEARMRAARPLPAARTGRAAPRISKDAGVARNPGRVPGSVPSTDGSGVYVGDAVGPTAYEYPFPFSRRTVEPQLQKVFPYRTVGKVFMRQSGVDYVCSGASVTSAPRQVVFTAGHCLHDGAGHWSNHVVFVPARRDRSNPYGTFAAKQLWALAGWTTSADRAYDQAAFDVAKNATHKTLQSQVGTLGMAWNQDRIQHWDIFGYPAGSPFHGERLTVCEASHAIDDNVSDDGYDTIGIGCDMTGGSSGGPWVLGLGRGNYINGLVSYGYDAEPLGTYGPYFSDATNSLRCSAATGHADAADC